MPNLIFTSLPRFKRNNQKELYLQKIENSTMDSTTVHELLAKDK